jgi:hypothetical protein
MVGANEQDSLLAAIVKWIPVEVLTVYKAVDGFIPADKFSFHLTFILLVIILCALWIAFATRPSNQQIAWRQVILAPVAFTCWAVAMQSDLLKHFIPQWESWMGSVVLGVGILLLPVLEGILKALGVTQSE